MPLAPISTNVLLFNQYPPDLRRHHALPLLDEVALGAVAVPELAVPLVALEPGDEPVVPAPGALRLPGGLAVQEGRHAGGLVDSGTVPLLE